MAAQTKTEGVFKYECPKDFIPELALPFDEALPNLVIPHLIIFRAPPKQDKQHVSSMLQEAVRATANEIPILACDVYPASTEQEAENAHGPKYRLKPAALQLTVQDVSADFAFEAMQRSNFCDDYLPGDVFSDVAEQDDPEKGVPMCSFKASFIEGGVVICLGFNHLFGDAQSYNLATRALARHCRAAALSQESTSSLSEGAQNRQLLPAAIPQKPTADKVSPSLTAPLPPTDGGYAPSAPPGPASTQLIRISPSKLPELKAAAAPLSDETRAKWISTHDAVCALLFESIFRARRAEGILSGDEETLLYSVAVDLRSYLSGLPEDWLGNSIGALRMEVPTGEALGADALPRLAAAIRSSIADVDETKVRDFFAHARATPGYMLLDNEVGRASSDRGIMLTPWRNFHLASMDWPEEMGQYLVMRFPKKWQPIGWFVIFPDLEDGTWEITTHIEERIWKHMARDEQLLKFASIAWSR